ncbi:MAG: DUF378 domain-containing protein [Candidatus Paceibacterota bacterium]|jgi:uncharacterized membrane protein YuzA (DUF378 family)
MDMGNKGMCICSKIGKILLIIGGLNWGLIGIGMLMGNSREAWNVVNMIFGSMPIVEGIIYVLVGIAAVMKIFGCRCKKNMEAHGACCGTEKMEEKM